MKLTRDQRAELFAGGFPRIAFDGMKPCPVELGDTYRLSGNLTISVTGVRRAKTGEHVLEYLVRDMRVRNLLSVIPAAPPRKQDLDRWGRVPPPTAAEERRAAQASAYGASADHIDAGEAVSADAQSDITKLGTQEWMKLRAKENSKREIRSAANRLRELEREANRSDSPVDPELLRGIIDSLTEIVNDQPQRKAA